VDIGWLSFYSAGQPAGAARAGRRTIFSQGGRGDLLFSRVVAFARIVRGNALHPASTARLVPATPPRGDPRA
jgi:hypothetical protein